MSSTCFEPEGSSSGRQLYIQLRFGTFYMHQYKTLVPTRLFMLMHINHTIPHTTIFLKMNPRVRKL